MLANNNRLIQDQIGSTIISKEFPKHIISLVPSQTELLYYLGLDKEVIGITKFCIHPKIWHNTKTRVGGTKTLNLPLIKKLKPDLIIANKEENEKSQIEELKKQYSVWISDIKTLEDAYNMIGGIGKLTNTEAKAENLINHIKTAFKPLNKHFKNSKKRAAYFIWNKPYMTINKNTFIHYMLEQCGLENVFKKHSARYPVTTIEELQKLNIDLLLLSSEPFPFKEKHKLILQKHLPKTNIKLVDGELFSWYGSRLLHSPQYFKSLFSI